MNIHNSVRFRIVIGFVALIAPLVLFLYYNNYYASHVVREQISANYQNLLEQYARNTDSILYQSNLYLFQMMNDPDISILYSYKFNTDEYNLARVRILNKLTNQLGYFNMINMFFIYSKTNHDLILASQTNYPNSYQMINAHMQEILSNLAESGRQKWQTVRTSDGVYALTQSIKLYPGVYAGAWVDMKNLGVPLTSWDMGRDGGASLMSDTGQVLYTQLPGKTIQTLWAGAKPKKSSAGYYVAEDQAAGSKMLLIQVPSDFAHLRYIIAVNEKRILKNLPYFQFLVYLIPLVGLIVISLYLMLMQRIFFRPLTDLIRGMRRLAQGRFDFRLARSKSSEFNFLVGTFNDMAGQIENLKINIYEEKLKVQQAELKQLQVQINPHFYMNSLNIIYNLAALKNFKSVQKMALYLADYFRFTMRSNRDVVSLREELKHIVNYLEIQQLRYPGLLEYDVRQADEHETIQLPPLTLQPFVENAVLHGLNQNNKIFRIKVASGPAQSGSGNLYEVIITDNGKGFSPDMLKLLQSDNYMNHSRDEHVGIWNVIRRMKVHFGQEFQYAFRNGDAEGAMVILRFPMRMNANEFAIQPGE